MLTTEKNKGTRPNLMDAMPPDEARPFYDAFLAELAAVLGPEKVAGPSPFCLSLDDSSRDQMGSLAK